jgi:SAM-dependent methyltransferase/thiamine kinase-like enzyme
MIMRNKEKRNILKRCIRNFVCPRCKSALRFSREGLYCPNDNEHFPFKDGVIEFLREKDYIYSEIGERLTPLEKEARTVADIDTLKRLIYRKYGGIYKNVFSSARADFLYLLSKVAFLKTNIFLDAGCGYGNITMYTSDKMTCSYALDATYARIQFFRKWLEMEGKKNIVPIFGSITDLPFDHNVDVLLLDGVFEYVGTFEVAKKVEDAQLDVLKEAHRALSKRGVLVICIENRFSPVLLPKKDHSGLYFTNFFPRRLANICTRLLKKKPYRTYTYDYWRYIHLLTEAGFKETRIFGCFPVYRFPRYTYSLEDTRAVEFIANLEKIGSFKRKIFFEIMSKNVLLTRLFSPSLIIYGFKEKRDTNDEFVGDLAISGWGRSVKIFDLKKNVVTSVLRSKKFSRFLSEQIKVRKSFSIKAPKLVAYSKSGGYIIEKRVIGNNLENILKKNPFEAMKMLQMAFDNLWKFYSCQQSISVDVDKYLTHLLNKLKKYEKHKAVETYIKGFYNTTERFLSTIGAKQQLAILKVHGDFSMGNIICSNKDCYIIDWECTRKASIFYDYFNLLSLYALHNSKHRVLKNIVNRTKPSDDLGQFMSKIFDEYITTFKLSIKNLGNRAPFYLIFLLERMLYHLENEDPTDVEYEIKRWYQLKKDVLDTN